MKNITEDEETLFHARSLSVWASTQSGFPQGMPDHSKHFICKQQIKSTLLLKEALEKAKRDAKVLKTSFLPPSQKGHAVEAIASSQLSCI